MKKLISLLLSIPILLGCTENTKETKTLSFYLHSYGIDIKNYKVISFIPANGCYSCILPAIELAKESNQGYLLVISANSQKSIDDIIYSANVKEIFILNDPENEAAKLGLVPITTARYYIIQNGQIEEILDINAESDKIKHLAKIRKLISK